ncbi:hypothetical protein SEA_MISCHIEF19_17 [Streptomyces phage Mischief19]|nr:hypothetical protein SEA_MISCHIEF19_17 [Streptomyces phage Mischief19]
MTLNAREESSPVTEHVYIEPAEDNRRQFARWCLDQTPRIETASATGSNVPVDLYPEVPATLLEGAYVDGYLYRKIDPVPAVRPDGSTPPAKNTRRRPAKQTKTAAPATENTEGEGNK